MFALQYDRFGGPEVLAVREAPEPHAQSGEIRIRVRAAGVAPTDALLRAGRIRAEPPHGWPHIPGVDAAGVVDEVGPGVLDVAVGDQVFGAVDVMGRLGGASTEFAVLTHWARKPAAVGWAAAGGAATSIETAVRVLDLLTVARGATVLVDGGAGAVGSTVVQLARARGADVIATASSRHRQSLAALGAHPVVYGPGLAGRVRGLIDRVDHAVDVAGAGDLQQLVDLVGDPTQVVSIADFSAPQLGVRLSYGGSGESGWHGLADAAALMEQGGLAMLVREVLPLHDGARAHDRVATGHGRGKIVLDVRAARHERGEEPRSGVEEVGREDLLDGEAVESTPSSPTVPPCRSLDLVAREARCALDQGGGGVVARGPDRDHGSTMRREPRIVHDRLVARPAPPRRAS